mmetsp:Transcript_14216/g.28638  ORF Transcript_14216/g.28638 Transcript_14216/m.28638 type:complete len:269 (-) Transcript_14216:83-889(-)
MDPEAVTDEHCGVERVDDLSAEDFERYYRKAEKPVIVKISVDNLGLDSPAEVSEAIGSLLVTAGESYKIAARGTHRLSLSAFIEKRPDDGWREGLQYVVDKDVIREATAGSALAKLVQAPTFLRPESLGSDAWRYLLVGHDGAAVSNHKHAEGYNLLVYGTKIWGLESPSGEHSTCEQRAGELIYLPSGWYHEVRSIGETFGTAVQQRYMPFTWRHGLSFFSVLFLLLHAVQSQCRKALRPRSEPAKPSQTPSKTSSKTSSKKSSKKS